MDTLPTQKINCIQKALSQFVRDMTDKQKQLKKKEGLSLDEK